MNLSVYRVAKDSGIPQSTLAAIVGGKGSISAETAMRLGFYFGVDAQFWLNLQTRYHLMMLDDRRRRIEKGVHPAAWKDLHTMLARGNPAIGQSRLLEVHAHPKEIPGAGDEGGLDAEGEGFGHLIGVGGNADLVELGGGEGPQD